MTYTALIPVKDLHEAKSRLAPHLSQEERRQLVMEMLHHVIRVLLAGGAFERVSVVSPDACVLGCARAWGAQGIPEEAQGHNPALRAAAQRELASGAEALLTISADLPLLQVSDVQSMIEWSYCRDVVLAPSQEGTGTNALLVRPPLAMPYLFGPGSLQRYVEEAKRLKLTSALYTSMGTSFDVDTIENVEELYEHLQCAEVASA